MTKAQEMRKFLMGEGVCEECADKVLSLKNSTLHELSNSVIKYQLMAFKSKDIETKKRALIGSLIPIA